MKKLIATGAATFFLSGCATIIEGGSQPVTIKSVPEAASISVTNRAGEKVHTGVTPTTVVLKRGAGYFKSETYTIDFAMAGYQPKSVTVTGSTNGWYIANILIGGLIGMLIVDPLTGAMYTLSPATVSASLDPSVKTSAVEGSLTVMLAQDVSPELMKQAREIKMN